MRARCFLLPLFALASCCSVEREPGLLPPLGAREPTWYTPEGLVASGPVAEGYRFDPEPGDAGSFGLGVWTRLSGGEDVEKLGDHAPFPVWRQERIDALKRELGVELAADGAALRERAGERVGFVGAAERAKLGPIVVGAAGSVYCLELEEWPDDVVGVEIFVAGVVEVTDDFAASVDSSGAISQGTGGRDTVMKSVEYEKIGSETREP